MNAPAASSQDSASVCACLVVTVAWSLWSRVRGLLGRPAPEPGCCLLIPRCRSVHTIGMAYSIDIVFLDTAMNIVAIHSDVPPGRLRIAQRNAEFVLELRAGEAGRLGLGLGATPSAHILLTVRLAH